VKISELSAQSGVPVATVKFYLREGLLASGAKSSQTQSSYDDSHVARLRLIRAFLEVGGLSVAAAKRVLEVMDDETLPFGVAAGVASTALPAAAGHTADGRGNRDLASLIARRGWTVDPQNPGWALAARVIDDYAALGRDDLITTLDTYADAAERVAGVDLQTVVDADGRAQKTETVVIGTVLGDSLLAGLRRMAHEHFTRTLYPVPPEIAQRYEHAPVHPNSQENS
jgi:DNA-binding transcriptional MerR regulator